jgi:hypothetical protein
MHQLARIFGAYMYITLLVLPLASSELILASYGEAAPAQGPIVRDPVSPKSSDTPAQELTPAPQWKPGDPVQVRPDLRETPPPPSSEPKK